MAQKAGQGIVVVFARTARIPCANGASSSLPIERADPTKGATWPVRRALSASEAKCQLSAVGAAAGGGGERGGVHGNFVR